MPNGLNFVSQFEGELGIPIHAREFANALEKEIKVNKIQLGKGFKTIQGPGLIFWYPHNYGEYNVFEKTLGYFVFEYNKIPRNFIEEINKLDGICTPSNWAKKTLIENGVTVPVFVIPGGVNHEKFNSKNRKLNKDIFRFLHIGKAEKRKGTELVIRAFNDAFRGNKNIRLTLSIDNPHIPGFKSEDYLKEMNDGMKWPLDNIDIIHFTKNMQDLYNTHNVGVFPTRAEGIGLPIVEAMSSAMPVIVSNNTGITEYANINNSILLNDLEKIQVYDEHFFPKSGEFGTWMSPKVSEIREKMIWCYENQEEANRIGEIAESYMENNYSWSLAAKTFIKECL